MVIIYGIKNKVNGKFYVGSTVNFSRRKKEHLRLLRRGLSKSFPLQNAWIKYKEMSFEWIILEVIDNQANRALKEEDWIVRYNSIKNGYNSKLPYTEQKFSSFSDYKYLNSEEWLIKNGPRNLKKITKEEWIEERKRNPFFKLPAYYKKGNKEYCKEVIGVNKEGKIVQTFTSISEATKSLHINRTYLEKCLRNNELYTKSYSCKKLYWYKHSFDRERFLLIRKGKEKRLLLPHERNIKRTPISMQNTNTLEVRSFPSCTQAAKFLGVTDNKIHELRRGYANKGKGRLSQVKTLKGWVLKKC